MKVEDAELEKMMVECTTAIREAMGGRFEEMGYILVVRSREVGRGFYLVASDVADKEAISWTLGAAALMVQREPGRMIHLGGSGTKH